MATRMTAAPSSSPGLQNSAGEEERSAKRQKVAAACDQCREKKIKCDGVKPICRPCQKRFGTAAHCEWGERKTRSVGASKLEIIRLQSRISELERHSRRKSFTDDNEQPRSSSGTPLSTSDPNHHSGANAMMGLIEEGERAEESVVGDSSAASFMNRIKAVLDHQMSPDSAQQSHHTNSSSNATGITRQRRFKNPDYVLPSRHQADKLLEIYWWLVDPLYPFIDKDDFMGKYRSLWTGTPTMDDEICFICLLNAMLAVGCILDTTIRPQERVSSGEVYYKRAQGYVDLDFLQFQSVHTVQCLLLLAQYLQSTREPQQCWLFVGLAIRIAQSLGLDLPSTSASAATKSQADFLRKVWHGCILMDRILSMTFGRPAIITSEAAGSVPRPLPHSDMVDCTCFRDLCTFNPDSPDLHFFIETLKLYEIMSETLSALYNPALRSTSNLTSDSYTAYFGSSGTQAAGKILEIDGKYSTWQRNLPFHLRYTTAPDFPPHMMHGRQAKVLLLRHAHIRTLLFRPVLSRFCSICHQDDDASLARDTLAYKLALQCSVMCVQSALYTVDLFGKVHAEVRIELLDELLPAWWYCILYLYTAATVLVAARLNTTIMTEMGGEEVILNASRTVTACLHRYGVFGKHAQRSAAAVGLLFDQIPRQGVPRPAPAHGDLGTQAPTTTTHPSGTVEVQDWSYDPSNTNTNTGQAANMTTNTTMPPTSLNANYMSEAGQTAPVLVSSMLDDPFFDPSDMRFDLDLGGDMSWLSSIPFELYSENV